MFGQTVPFFEYLPSNTPLTTGEQNRFINHSQDTSTLATWIMKINPIQDYLNVRNLQVILPEIANPITFQADGVLSLNVGTYYWTGFNPDGSSISISKTNNGILGMIYIAPQNKAYKIASLSNQLSLLVKKDVSDYPNSGCAIDFDIAEDSIENGVVSERTGCENPIIRILFLHTQAAIDLDASVETQFPDLVLNQLNTACMSSGLAPSDVWFSSVTPLSILLPEFAESNLARETARRVKHNNTAKSLRDQFGADIVCLFCGSFDKGSATGAIKGDGWVVAAVPQVDHYFKMSHGVGHVVIGKGKFLNVWDGHQLCRNCCHDQCAQHCPGEGDCKIIMPLCNYDHAYKLPFVPWRTIMADCGSSEYNPKRIARWSSPDHPITLIDLVGQTFIIPTGDADSDNARVIRENAKAVACFRPEPNVNNSPDPTNDCTSFITIQGPSCIETGDIVTLSAMPSITNLTWEKSNDGTTFESIGQGQTVSFLLDYPQLTTLYVRVSNGFGVCGKFQKVIGNCFTGGGIDRNSSANPALNRALTISPNPTFDKFKIEGTSVTSMLSVVSLINGQEVIPFSQLSKNEVDLSNFPSGVYLVHIQNLGVFSSHKIIKL